jgi:hypothetical protein
LDFEKSLLQPVLTVSLPDGRVVKTLLKSLVTPAPCPQALMTGSIPGFVDVALNFAAAAAVEDSVVRQLQGAGRGVVFYGDDTWMRLFPGMFMRQEGTTSFFVTDYTEVSIPLCSETSTSSLFRLFQM